MFILTVSEEHLIDNFSVEKHNGDFLFVLGIHGERDFTDILSTKVIKEKYVYFHKDGMDIENIIGEDLDETDEDIVTVPVSYISEMLDKIVDIVLKSESIDPNEETNDYTPVFIVSGEMQTASKLTFYLERALRHKHSDVIPMHFLREYRFVNLKAAKESMKISLDTSFIDPSDPLSFNYAIWAHVKN